MRRKEKPNNARKRRDKGVMATIKPSSNIEAYNALYAFLRNDIDVEEFDRRIEEINRGGGAK